jgi:hypothetical protein
MRATLRLPLHHQVLPEGIQMGHQEIEGPRQAIVIALGRLDPEQLGQDGLAQPGLDMDQGLRSEQPVEDAQQGHQTQVEVRQVGLGPTAATVKARDYLRDPEPCHAQCLASRGERKYGADARAAAAISVCVRP